MAAIELHPGNYLHTSFDGNVAEAHTSVGQSKAVAMFDTHSSPCLASAGRLRDASVFSHRQARSYPGVVVLYLYG